VEVQDEGKGIPALKRSEIELAGKAGVGLRGMRERIRQLGGILEIGSLANGRGTVVIARFPMERGSDELSKATLP
jgi:signal transduction histidine kinase